jgi:hypothetical protein
MSVKIRPEVVRLKELGALPDESNEQAYADDYFEEVERLLDSIDAPVNREEAEILIQLFPPVSCYGMGWTILHLVESVEETPVEMLIDQCNSEEWKNRLTERAENANKK